MKFFISLLLLSCLISCATNPPHNNNDNSAPSSANRNNADLPFSGDDEDTLAFELEYRRPEARQKAIDYVQQNFPDWHIKGIVSRLTFDKHYEITLDLEKDDQTRTVQLLLRLFFPERGEPYWRVEPVVATSSRQHQELNYLRAGGCREQVLNNLEMDEIPDSLREAIIDDLREAAYEDDREDDPE